MKARGRGRRRSSGESAEGRLDETGTWILKERLESLRKREKTRRPEPPRSG